MTSARACSSSGARPIPKPCRPRCGSTSSGRVRSTWSSIRTRSCSSTCRDRSPRSRSTGIRSGARSALRSPTSSRSRSATCSPATCSTGSAATAATGRSTPLPARRGCCRWRSRSTRVVTRAVARGHSGAARRGRARRHRTDRAPARTARRCARGDRLMRFTETEIAGVVIVDLEPIADDRGWFARSFCRDEFLAHGLDPTIVQCNVSVNRDAGTIRGMHYQVGANAETKLVRCVRGAVHDVVVDLRPESPTRLGHVAVELTRRDPSRAVHPDGLRPRLPDARGRHGSRIQYGRFVRKGGRAGCPVRRSGARRCAGRDR